MGTKLLCVFCKKNQLERTLYLIKDIYEIQYNYIFVLQDVDDPSDLFITFNINTDDDYRTDELSCILLHRKKHTNTLYTINALNALIRELNYGVLDESFNVNWVQYKNCILLTDGSGYKKINTRIHQVHTL